MLPSARLSKTWQDAERLARAARGDVEPLVIEDGNHVANNRAYRYRPQTADWMGEPLGARAAPVKEER